MSKMSPRDIVLAQLHHRDTPTVPYVLAMEPCVAERVDAHYGGTQWRQRLQPFMTCHFAVDTIRETPINETHGTDIFGSIWRRDQRPWHLETPALRSSSLAGFKFPCLEQFIEPVAAGKDAACERIRADREHAHIIAMGWGIFEQTWRIRGFEDALMDAVAEPAFYEDLIAHITELYVGMVRFCADVPADAIMFGDDWGDQRDVILGPERWRHFIKPAWAKVYDEVHRQGKLVISHSCGSVATIMGDAIEIGLDVLESVQPEAAGMNPYGLKRQWGDRLAFYGCLGSQSTIPFGSPQQIRDEVQRLCREVGKSGGFILSTAKPLQPETPTENAVAIVEAFTNQVSQ